MTDKALAELAIRQKALLDAGAEILKANRAQLVESLDAGDRVATPVGKVNLTEPKDSAVIVDRDELDRFLLVEGKFTVVDEITDIEAAIAVLRVHAPELVRRVETVPEWARSEAQDRAKRGEGIPGVQVRAGSPVLQIRPDADVKAWAVQAMTTGMKQVTS